ncbi:MAG: chemotaxis response regulator protein-glutamate methylesterase [Cyanobacteria bacterium P01_F01_bin.150]
MLNIAIVNDSAIAIEALRRAILTIPDYQLLWVAQTGADAIQQSIKQTPDLILMDMHMPNLDGVEATRQIMQQAPCPILIVTASISRHSNMVFQAMSHGALDVVKTPQLGTGNPDAVQFLLKKVAILSRYSQHKISKHTIPQHNVSQSKPSQLKSKDNPPKARHQHSRLDFRSQTQLSTYPASRQTTVPSGPPFQDHTDNNNNLPQLVVIGASTGGPGALKTILSQLPKPFNAAIIVIQHIDEQFTLNLVQWLNQFSTLPVALAQNGDRPEPGKVLVSGGGQHLWMRPNQKLRYTHEPHDYPYRPSVDVFFNSVAAYWKQPGIALLLTGMGKDGAIGMKHLREAKWHTVAESQSSCVVFGMPKAAINLGAAQQALTLTQIPSHLVNLLG